MFKRNHNPIKSLLEKTLTVWNPYLFPCLSLRHNFHQNNHDSHLFYFSQLNFFKKNLFIERKGEKGEETDIGFLLYPSVHSLVDSCMCPDQGSNLQPRRIRMTL